MGGSSTIEFSLFFFASDAPYRGEDKFRLVVEGAQFADDNGFAAVWIPEQHFHALSVRYPQPASLAAALAAKTERVRIRAGGTLPVSSPARLAEDWSILDNISNGRVDLALAESWRSADILSSVNRLDAQHKDLSAIRHIRQFWRGVPIDYPNGTRRPSTVSVLPRPQQQDLPTWICCSKHDESFSAAGAIGVNVLTTLLSQSIDELQRNITRYRDSRLKSNLDPRAGRVTVMLHTFVGKDLEQVERQVQEPFKAHLKDAAIWSQGIKGPQALSSLKQRGLLQRAFEKYCYTRALFGTPDSCQRLIVDLRSIGVDEIACIVDFGVPHREVLETMPQLRAVQETLDMSRGTRVTRGD